MLDHQLVRIEILALTILFSVSKSPEGWLFQVPKYCIQFPQNNVIPVMITEM
jgi:hypothetical protein